SSLGGSSDMADGASGLGASRRASDVSEPQAPGRDAVLYARAAVLAAFTAVFTAAFACFATDANAAGLLTASSARLLRSSVTPAEIALLAAAADERVLQRGVDRFLRGAIQLALVGVVALREPQQLLALGASDRASLHSRHSFAPQQPEIKN